MPTATRNACPLTNVDVACSEATVDDEDEGEPTHCGASGSPKANTVTFTREELPHEAAMTPCTCSSTGCGRQ